MNTDEIVQLADHIEKNKVKTGEILAAAGIDPIHAMRAISVLCEPGDGHRTSYMAGMLIGIQLGAMRLSPVEYKEPDNQHKLDEDDCQCLACTIRRSLGDMGFDLEEDAE